MAKNVIEVKNISKRYKLYNKPSERLKEAFGIGGKKYYTEFYALHDVSFKITEGETVGIVGRNGSGKSTILKILTGVINSFEGGVEIGGKISALLELGAGFNVEYTGMENIYLNATIMNISRKEMEKKIPDILSFADIGDHIHQPVKTYSSGMFVRLAFAVAVNVNPDILIVDEALAVGDTRFQLKCMDKFMEFMEAGKTVLFVSHDINSIKRFCKRTIWLNQGKVIMDGKTDEVTDRYMDFLKSEQTIEEYQKKRKIEIQSKEEVERKVLDTIDIAKIDKVQMFNEYGEEIQDIRYNSSVNLKVSYYVGDSNIEKPVLGVAIRRIDNEYICGINTLLDHVNIPWDRGYNEVVLSYKRFNLTGGEYYFDVALFDSTATVQIDYQTKIKDFFVKMDYVAEGIVVLHHEWIQ